MADKSKTQLQREAEAMKNGQRLVEGAPIFRSDSAEARMGAAASGYDPLKDYDKTKTIQVMGPDGTMITRPGISDFVPPAPRPEAAPEEAPIQYETKRDFANPQIRYKQIKNKVMSGEELSDDDMNFKDEYEKDPRSFNKLMGAMQADGPLKPKWGN
jgi:hypothetical protein